MRTLVAVMLFLAIPTFAAAQQATDAVEAAPVVELQQSTAPTTAAAVDAEAPAPDIQLETQSSQADQPAAMQDPATRQWWYLVGAIVVGGIILAVLL